MNAEIGEAAGKVWQALEVNGPMAKTALKTKTKLDADLLAMALGWLAREDKVVIERVEKRKIQVTLK
jgi:hypothetical protein